MIFTEGLKSQIIFPSLNSQKSKHVMTLKDYYNQFIRFSFHCIWYSVFMMHIFPQEILKKINKTSE